MNRQKRRTILGLSALLLLGWNVLPVSAGYSQSLPSPWLAAGGDPRGKAKYDGTCDFGLCGFSHLLQVQLHGV